MGLLGGRVAEEIDFNEMTTGAHNDFEKATKIARAMVTEYGMSDLGPVQFEHQESSVFLGRDYNKSRNFSGQVAFEIDQEQRKIINECYEKAKKVIKENRDLLDLIANALLENETLTKEQIDYLVEHGCMPEEDVAEVEDDKQSETVENSSASDFEELSYNDLSEELLYELCLERNIEVNKDMDKDTLIKLLQDDDKEDE